MALRLAIRAADRPRQRKSARAITRDVLDELLTTCARGRAIGKTGQLGARALDPQSVNKIIKRRCAAAGLDVSLFSAHGLRSGYLTEAARQGVPFPEAMQQSRHKSVQQAARYYNEAQIARGRAARLA